LLTGDHRPIRKLLFELGYLKRVDFEEALAIQKEDRSKKLG